MNFDFDSLESAGVGGEVNLTQRNKDDLMMILKSYTTYEPYQKKVLEIMISDCDNEVEFMKIKKQILMNRIERKDRISMGFNYGYTDWKHTMRYIKEQPHDERQAKAR